MERKLIAKLYQIESSIEKERILKELSIDDFVKLVRYCKHYRETLEKVYKRLMGEHFGRKELNDKAKNPFIKIWWALSETAKKEWENKCSRTDRYIKMESEIVQGGATWKLVLLEIEKLTAESPDYNLESNYHGTYYSAINRFLNNMNNNVLPFIFRETAKRINQAEYEPET